MNDSMISRYWKYYGGWRALFKSWYFRLAFSLTILLAPHWLFTSWWETVLSIMPNLLGFTLGGFAMWMALGDDNFRKLICGDENDKTSPYMSVNAAFVHFVVLQVLAIFCALFADAYNFSLSNDNFILVHFHGLYIALCYVGAFIGYFLFVYSLLSALAATFALLRVSSWYELSLKNNQQKKKSDISP